MSINKKALEMVINGTPEERKYLCEKDFSLFMCYYFMDYIKYPFAPFHYEFFQDIKDLDNRVIRELAWIAFRESAKTSFAKIWLAWVICFQKKNYINVDSFDRENAERILFDLVLEMQTNRLIRQDFGNLYNAKKDPNEVSQKRINNFVTNNGVRVEAHSTQESVRGRLHGNQRPDCLLLDDFETNKTKDSVAYTTQVMEHINEFKGGLDSKAMVLYLGNYITEYGSIQSLMDRAVEDDRLRVRVVALLEGEEPTWPQKYCLTDEEAEETGKVSINDIRKKLGSQVFMVEMMNQPIDDSVAEFKKEWYKYTTMEELKEKETLNWGTIDPSFSEKTSADYTGIVVNMVTENNHWNIMSFGEKMNPKQLIARMFELYDKYKLEAWGIEEGSYLLSIKPFLDEEMARRNIFMKIIPVKTNANNKETRIRGLIPRYEAGSIVHVKGYNNLLEEQLRVFPRGRNDDVPDALSMQLQIAKKPYDGYGKPVVTLGKVRNDYGGYGSSQKKLGKFMGM
jgi:predicted phage terminase large subunit-like protein